MRILKAFSAAAAGLLWTSALVAAQPKPEEVERPNREVAVGVFDRPTPIFVVPNETVTLLFEDEPVGEVVLPGAEVRRHPSMEKAISITPSESLAKRSPVPFKVMFKDGEALLELDFNSGKRDRLVRVLRRTPPTKTFTLDAKAREDLLLLAAHAAFSLPTPNHLQNVSQPEPSTGIKVLAKDRFSYLRLRRTNPTCDARTVRLRRGSQTAEILLFVPTTKCEKPGTCSIVMLYTPETRDGFVLELLTSEGAVCEKHRQVILAP